WVNGQWYHTIPGIRVNPSWPDIIPGVNPNLYTISIDVEGQPSDVWTSQMFDANVRVLQWIATQYNIKYIPHHTLIGHNEIDPVLRPNSPGPNVDYERLANEANSASSAIPTTLPSPISTPARSLTVVPSALPSPQLL